MKPKNILFTAIVLFLLMAGVGCEKDEREKTILPIANLPEQVVTFFDEALSTPLQTNCFFVSEENDTHYLINSKEELQSLYSCNKELPEIDFASYSIIVGQKKMANSFYFVIEQHIKETQMLDLNIVVQLPSSGYWPAFSNMYYWGIYPKLPNKKINVNIIIKE